MSRDDFWTEKLAQLFHDPFLKAWCQGGSAEELATWIGGQVSGEPKGGDPFWERRAQDKVAMLLAQRMLGEELIFPGKWRLFDEVKEMGRRLNTEQRWQALVMADIAASGADRPVLGCRTDVYVKLWKPGNDHILVTHPLSAAPLRVAAPNSMAALQEKLAPALALLDRYRELLGSLSREERHRHAALLAWRRLPEDLAAIDGRFWPLQPADTRCPDHSIWDHLRVVSALAFLPRSRAADARVKADNQQRRPWLLTLWVGPAREFLGHARTSRDLWTGSQLLAELAWAMLEPVVEALGPNAVLYPDLRANPRADRWLARRHPGLLAGAPPGSRASLLPNRYVVVVPEAQLDDLVKAARDAVADRWREMAARVREFLMDASRLGRGGWLGIFDAQVEAGPRVRWVAQQWQWDGEPSPMPKRADLATALPPAFPFDVGPAELPKPLEEIEEKRRARFLPWVGEQVFRHYQAARYTYMQTQPRYLYNQRGFDYPLYHHVLLEALAARKRLGDERARERPEPGEKCTLCGMRQALSDRHGGAVGAEREAARELWRRIDPERTGAERLCAPCAVRRYLSESGDRIQENWRATLSGRRSGGRHQVPFPSTGLIAGQRWLAALCDQWADNRELREAGRCFVEAFNLCRLPRTQFAGSLARLRQRLESGLAPILVELLKIDIQYLDPERLRDLGESSGGVPLSSEESAAARQAAGAAARIRGQVRRRSEPNPARPEKPLPCNTHLAVIMLDGDRMGELLLGTPERVRARWRDVLHPAAVEEIRRKSRGGGAKRAWSRAWDSTLESSRLLGPSVHALISRALRHFSTRVLPWVVEREYGGKLIYAGGDDALILCPAEDALLLLTRLQSLFAAPWVVDLFPEESPWPREEPSAGAGRFRVESEEARSRFRPLAESDGEGFADLPGGGRIFPMLGPHSSFSAGVAFGHFKTSLRLLRAEAERGLQVAKVAGGGRASLVWFTRSGPKVRSLRRMGDGVAGGELKLLFELAEAFRGAGPGAPSLPRRLPYKLRQVSALARAAVPRTKEESAAVGRDDSAAAGGPERGDLLALLCGLIERAADGPCPWAEEIAGLWLSDLRHRRAAGAAAPAVDDDDGLGFLLLARVLSPHLPDSAHEAAAYPPEGSE
jgi:CRISPR-associated protein Cmr2